MFVKGFVCAIAGHRWAPIDAGNASVLVLQCQRCRSEVVHSAETADPEDALERWGRTVLAKSPFVDPREWDPRLRKRS